MTDRPNPYEQTGPAADARRLVDALETVEPGAPVRRTRAKFYISNVKLQAWGASVEFSAVSRGARNADWSSATPSGSITMTITNPDAVTELVKALRHPGGPEFFVTFDHAPLAYPDDGHAFVEPPEGHYVGGRCAECAEDREKHLS